MGCLRNARKAKKAAEAAEGALTGTGVGEGGMVEKQLAMDEKLNTLITNQANIEMVQGGIAVKQLAMDEKLNTLISSQANIEMVQGGIAVKQLAMDNKLDAIIGTEIFPGADLFDLQVIGYFVNCQSGNSYGIPCP